MDRPVARAASPLLRYNRAKSRPYCDSIRYRFGEFFGRLWFGTGTRALSSKCKASVHTLLFDESRS